MSHDLRHYAGHGDSGCPHELRCQCLDDQYDGHGDFIKYLHASADDDLLAIPEGGNELSHPVEIDPILLSKVSKPARYVGGEWNSVVKDHDQVKLTVAYCFPDVYEVAMSIWACASSMLCSTNGPMWLPNESMRLAGYGRPHAGQGLPAFSLETKTPVRDFDIGRFYPSI